MENHPNFAIEQPFVFEAVGAPVPILAANWVGEQPLEARIVFHNQKFIELYGDRHNTLLIDLFNEIVHSSTNKLSLTGEMLFNTLLTQGSIQSVLGRLADRRVELFAKLQTNTPNTIQATVFDVTDRLIDYLTELPNRELFFDRFSMNLYKALRNNETLTLLFLDLDGFKHANDVHGHQIGDAIIYQVAKRLRSVTRRHETIARLGGDEFVILLSNLSPSESLHFAEHKVIPLINQPYQLGQLHIHNIGVSIGIAGFPTHGQNVDELLSKADTAMYQAKGKGKNCAVIAV